MNIVENEFFTQGIDFEPLIMMMSGVEGQSAQDYAVTLDFAKHIAMMAKTSKAHEYRNYFIAIEKVWSVARDQQVFERGAIGGSRYLVAGSRYLVAGSAEMGLGLETVPVLNRQEAAALMRVGHGRTISEPLFHRGLSETQWAWLRAQVREICVSSGDMLRNNDAIWDQLYRCCDEQGNLIWGWHQCQTSN
jgi:phage anti-repressor protein